MAENTLLPQRMTDLIIRPVGKEDYIVKNPRTRAYFKIGPVEHFLLTSLDGKVTATELRQAFEAKFGEPLSREEVAEFISLVDRRGVLQGSSTAPASTDASDSDDEDYTDIDPTSAVPQLKKQSLLYWRYSFVDPDRIFNWLEPKIRFVWTAEFVVLTVLMMLFAGFITWTNRAELVTNFATHLTWETFALSWLVLIGVTTLHEFAHGLTCKHHGGEVHELGVLMIFFMPCFYCNVSDAWLIPEKSKRLWITAAGGYCDLCVWAMATIVWRLTMPDTIINYVAWIIMNICGTRGFINMNPLLRLDGYYLLCDWLGVANLRKRAQTRWMAIVRSVLWGAAYPAREENSGILLAYGSFTWFCSSIFLSYSVIKLSQSWGSQIGIAGVLLVLALYTYILTRIWRGLFRGEVLRMLTTRPIRTLVWIGVIAVGGFAASKTQIIDHTTGTFSVRPGNRVEVRAPVAGFLREVKFDEGDGISSQALIGRLEIPDLESQIAQKRAEINESNANVRRLQAGARPEEVREQRLKVERAVTWRDMARADLERHRQSLQEELYRYDELINQYRLEAEFLGQSLQQAAKLYQMGGLAGQQYKAERKRYDVAVSQYQQAHAQKRAREIGALVEPQAELGRREKELADVEAALKLLEAGTRPEQIDAELARLARLQEENRFLTSQREKLVVRSPITGFLTTARMSEKIGQYFEKGALICVVEDSTGLEAEVAVPEQDVAGVKQGQQVELKARSLPFEVFHAKVDRIAPRANKAEGSVQGTVTLYCRLDQKDANLLAGMTGVGRVTRGEDTPASIASRKLLQYVRTEFWW